MMQLYVHLGKLEGGLQHCFPRPYVTPDLPEKHSSMQEWTHLEGVVYSLRPHLTLQDYA